MHRSFGLVALALTTTTCAGSAQDGSYYWDPNIAPSGMAFYTGRLFPARQNSLFIGALYLLTDDADGRVLKIVPKAG